MSTILGLFKISFAKSWLFIDFIEVEKKERVYLSTKEIISIDVSAESATGDALQKKLS